MKPMKTHKKTELSNIILNAPKPIIRHSKTHTTKTLQTTHFKNTPKQFTLDIQAQP